MSLIHASSISKGSFLDFDSMDRCHGSRIIALELWLKFHVNMAIAAF